MSEPVTVGFVNDERGPIRYGPIVGFDVVIDTANPLKATLYCIRWAFYDHPEAPGAATLPVLERMRLLESKQPGVFALLQLLKHTQDALRLLPEVASILHGEECWGQTTPLDGLGEDK